MAVPGNNKVLDQLVKSRTPVTLPKEYIIGNEHHDNKWQFSTIAEINENTLVTGTLIASTVLNDRHKDNPVYKFKTQVRYYLLRDEPVEPVEFEIAPEGLNYIQTRTTIKTGGRRKRRSTKRTKRTKRRSRKN